MSASMDEIYLEASAKMAQIKEDAHGSWEAKRCRLMVFAWYLRKKHEQDPGCQLMVTQEEKSLFKNRREYILTLRYSYGWEITSGIPLNRYGIRVERIGYMPTLLAYHESWTSEEQ